MITNEGNVKFDDISENGITDGLVAYYPLNEVNQEPKVFGKLLNMTQDGAVSEDGFTYTTGASRGHAFIDIGKTSGQWYVECLCPTVIAMYGFASNLIEPTVSGALFGQFNLVDPEGLIHGHGNYGGIRYYTGNTISGAWDSIAANEVGAWWIDCDNNLLYHWKTGTGWVGGATFVTPSHIAIGAMHAGTEMTINVGQEPFVYPHGEPPVGVNHGIYTGGGEIVNDLSGNGNHGTNNGAIVFDGLKGKSAYDFDSTNVRCTIPQLPYNASQRTISFWFNPEVSGGGGTNIMGYGAESTGQLFDVILTGTQMGVHWYTSNPPAEFPNTIFTLNEWNYYTVTFDNTGIKQYMNGVLKDASPTIVNTTSIDDYFYIGRGYWSTYNTYNGAIQDVRIYDRALTEAEIKINYNLFSPIVNAGMQVNNNTLYVHNFIEGSLKPFNATTLKPNSIAVISGDGFSSTSPSICNVQAAVGQSVGHFYHEMTVSGSDLYNGGGEFLGFASSNVGDSDYFSGSPEFSMMAYLLGLHRFYRKSNEYANPYHTLMAGYVGDVFMFAVDTVSDTIRTGKNGVWYGYTPYPPSDILSSPYGDGTIRPMFRHGYAPTATVTFNFGQNEWTYPEMVPEGATGWPSE